jgi:hypothetical protein
VIRVLAFLVRRPDLTRDAFRAYYEATHVPTALPLLAGVTHYVRHHLREELHGRPDFDCMTAVEYPDAAAMEALLVRLEGPEGEVVRSDELRFMDKPANTFGAVETEPGCATGPGAREAAEVLVCVNRPAAASPEAFRSRFAEAWLPALRDAVAPSWWRAQWLGAGPARGAARFDAVIQLGGARGAAIGAWSRELEATGARVVVATVTAHATPLPHTSGAR